MPSSLLATHNLYQAPNLNAFIEAKEQLLHDAFQDSDYFAPQTDWNRKWDLLTTKLKNALPESMHDNFTRFVNLRKHVVENENIIQLAQMVAYFETIYFAHQTKNPAYELSVQKKELLQSYIFEVISPDICEPGIFTRFLEILNFVEKDKDWLTNFLTEHRRKMIDEIAIAYNAKYEITWVHSVHTFFHFYKLAAARQLGVPLSEEPIQDIYIIDPAKMNAYFEKAIEPFCKLYEKKIPQLVTEHILDDLLEFLTIDEQRLWQREALRLNLIQQDTLNKYLQKKSIAT